MVRKELNRAICPPHDFGTVSTPKGWKVYHHRNSGVWLICQACGFTVKTRD